MHQNARRFFQKESIENKLFARLIFVNKLIQASQRKQSLKEKGPSVFRTFRATQEYHRDDE